MKNVDKIWVICKVLLHVYALLGVYIILYDLVGKKFYREMDFIKSIPGDIIIYSILVGLPVAGVLSVFEKSTIKKIVGIMYIIFFISGLILIDRALV